MLRLTLERKKRGWSLRELARRTGIDQGTLSRLETRKLYPYPGWKRRLARILHVPADDLFEEVAEHERAGA